MNNDTLDSRKITWPDRYYGVIDPSHPRPQQILGWYDTWNLGYKSTLFLPQNKMVPLTQEQWDWHFLSGNSQAQINADGTVSRYMPPPPAPVPLSRKARRAMDSVESQSSVVLAMGETFGPLMRAYVKKLYAIMKGSDTTSTVLPTAPSDPTL
ncbi:hypothetical protein GS501_04880 [Saccharibacter sp. 17.LH.SD]|uniref:hypothetical protein n=1 Tax=Saccharibacter sp. 17.LH.SD TaxID=2689393 RepID=UPI001367ABC1|nr:hypothetical protein [Saccharibacter sp. 17.LH.SD]MXV44381.1 hypothetical protein [Saccharibacter sp. 17.LH.SD]